MRYTLAGARHFGLQAGEHVLRIKATQMVGGALPSSLTPTILDLLQLVLGFNAKKITQL
jgi:hypothetical protein